MSELDAFDPPVETVKLSTGTVVALEDLRTRQFFKLLRILTHGALPVLQQMLSFTDDTDPEAFSTRLLSLLLLSIPDSEDETLEFLHSMVRPVGLVPGRKLNKQDTERNTALWTTLDGDLENPELDDLITLVEAIVRRESSDIQALGKRLMAMLRLAEKTGQVPPGLSERTAASLADSPEPSTSSPPSTDGPTPSSVTSPSGDSVSASQPSESGGL
jgi:hypothetical protein